MTLFIKFYKGIQKHICICMYMWDPQNVQDATRRRVKKLDFNICNIWIGHKVSKALTKCKIKCTSTDQLDTYTQ